MPHGPFGDDDSGFVLRAMLFCGGNRERIRRVMLRLQATSSRDENGKLRSANGERRTNGSIDADQQQHERTAKE